ncbi:DeoR/GlpR family DNA-binding transcription regulator [Microbacterium sp.]|uniref:DeoR/GlpR family DNA-binding transcription regulator n=1 Tax=Microbacterium sp. TaxID=51671 RepID=UPI0039E30A5B
MRHRELRILELLDERGSVRVDELAATLEVSAVTVRKDLEYLEAGGHLVRNRGGAVRAGLREGEFPKRLRIDVAAKQAVAVAAARHVAHGDVVAFDTSSTAYFVAREVVDRQNLVVVTSSLPTATLFLGRPTARVLMPGGTVRHESAGLVGANLDQLAGLGRISKGFFGLTGLSVERGLLEFAFDETATKRMLVDACTEVHAVFASEKAGGFGFHSFCPPDAVTSLITDDGLDAETADLWRALGVDVELAPLSGAAEPAVAAWP